MRFVIWIILLVGFLYNFSLIDKFFQRPTKDSISQYMKALSTNAGIRAKYGSHGRDMNEDYQKYKRDQIKSSPETSMSYPFSSRRYETSQGGHALPVPPAGPQGVHANNYSLYDINNPSGFLGKL